jgi:hypothetical protein
MGLIPRISLSAELERVNIRRAPTPSALATRRWQRDRHFCEAVRTVSDTFAWRARH